MSERFMKDFNGEKIFSLEYDKETLRDMVIAKQEEIERLKEEVEKYKKIILKSTRIIDKFKETYIICFDDPLWRFVKRLEKCLKGSEQE